MKYKIFKKIGVLLIICAIVGMFGINAVSADWVAHRGRYFKTDDYVTNGYVYGLDGRNYSRNINPSDWGQANDFTDWNINDGDWRSILSDLYHKGYGRFIYNENVRGKTLFVWKFYNKTMASGDYYEYNISSSGPDFIVRLSVNNNKTSGWF